MLEPWTPTLNFNLTKLMVKEDFTTRSKLRDIGRWYVTSFVKDVSVNLPAGTLILDAGAGECAYKKYFPHCRYMAVDLAVGEPNWNYANLDFVASLDSLPVKDNSFDAVLSTQTLEHLEYPREAVDDLCRVLKPGGRLFLTAPMAQSEHQVPYDFFRYTSFGLRSICNSAGFTEIEIEPFNGMFTRWAYEASEIMSIFPLLRDGQNKINWKSWRVISSLPLRVLFKLFIVIMQILFIKMDYFDREKKGPLGWKVVAKK